MNKTNPMHMQPSPADIDTRIKWAALHHAGYQDKPDLSYLVDALTHPNLQIWSYAQRILRRVLPMSSLLERWPQSDTRGPSPDFTLPDWIQSRCTGWGRDHRFVALCADLLADTDEDLLPLCMQRLAPFFGTGRLVVERLNTAGHQKLATRFQQFVNTFMEKQFPRQLTVIPTMACQLNCRYCYSSGLPPTRSNTMTQKELIRLLDWAENSGITRICLAGGEPTLYPHLDTLIDWVDDHGMAYFLSTNGLFPQKVLDCILARQPLSVSLHINPEIYHTSKHAQFISNARAFADSNIMTALRFNLVTATSDEYLEYLDLCDEIGVREIRLAVPVPNFSRSNTFVNLNADLKAYALTIDRFVATSRQRGIEVMLSKPFPLCLLALETAEVFLENGSFNACCQVHLQRHTQNLTVYPGMRFSPCLSLNQPSAESILSSPDIYKAAETYTEDLDRLSQIPLMEACRHCPLSMGGRCVGACLSYRVGSDATIGFRNQSIQ